MTGQRSATRTTGEDGPVEPSRRRFIAGLGVAGASALAGCNGVLGDDAPSYEDGSVEDVDGEPRTAEEMAAAEAVAEQEPTENATPLSALSVDTHEFVLEDDFRRSTVQGTLTNTGSDRLQFVEVRVRAYDDGDQLGRYLSTTGDLDPGSTWAFEVVLLESPADIDTYDVTALGTPN